MTIKITKEEFEEWKDLPATKRLFQFFGEEAQAHRDLAAGGGCFDKTFDPIKTGTEYLRRMVMASLYENIVYGITYEDLCPEISQEEEKSINGNINTPSGASTPYQD